MMCLETQIRALAEQGHSRRQAGRALGLSVGKMKLICDSMTGLTWQRAKGSGIPARKNVGHDSAIGESIRKTRPRRTAVTTHKPIYKLDGVEGTLLELMVHFKVMWTIGTVQKRLAAGKSLEEALTGGRPKVRDWSSCAL